MSISIFSLFYVPKIRASYIFMAVLRSARSNSIFLFNKLDKILGSVAKHQSIFSFLFALRAKTFSKLHFLAN